MHRSYLYVPGDRVDRMPKALSAGADAVIVDLEDAVAADAKDTARAAVVAFLSELAPGGPAVLVRINATSVPQDLDALEPVLNRLDALYVPKATVSLLEQVDALLGVRALPVVALVESAQGLLDAAPLARHRRVRNLAIGEADLTAELGIGPDAGPEVLAPLRMTVIVASAAAGIDPPTGPVSTEVRDLTGYRASTEAVRAMGFGARSAIHPDQVGVINEVFTPTAEELAAARAVVEGHDAALARGEAVHVDDRGRMVDEAVVRAARRLLAG